MKYIIEFGKKKGFHASETITLHNNKEAAKLAASLVLVLTQDNSIPNTVQATWYLSRYASRITWDNDSYYVALSKLDGVPRGAASATLWGKQ
jgi:hypothetical protein